MLKSKRLWAVAVSFLAVCVVIAVLVRRHQVTAHAASPAAVPSAESRIPARSKSARLLPMPKPIREPQRIEGLNEAEGVEQTITLKNGIAARLFAGKSSYPASAPVDLHLTLYQDNGEPLNGRRDLDAIIVDPTAGDSVPQRAVFTENEDEPGTYDLTADVPSSWNRVAVLLQVSETGSVSEPGESQLVQVNVDHSGMAALVGPGDATLRQDGARVMVLATAGAPGRATVAAELRDGDGESFGRATATAELKAGVNAVELRFAQLGDSSSSASHAFYLFDLRLDVDGRPTDFRPSPVPVSFMR